MAKLRDPVVLKCPHSDIYNKKAANSVEWYKSGVAIVTEKHGTMRKINGKDLFLRYVREEDFGEYECSLSSNSSSATFYVRLEKAGTLYIDNHF